MSAQPNGRSGIRWRFAARHPVGAILLFAVPFGVAGLGLLLAGRSVPVASIFKVSEIVLLLLSPTLLFGAIWHTPRGVRAVRRLVDNRRAERNPRPSSPPIEQISADLRRLLWQHDTVVRSSDSQMRARRLWALEAAITDRATQAARALDVPHPEWQVHVRFDQPLLRRLLRALSAEGLVLPSTVGLLAPDSHEEAR